jgi:hypothetical protein
MNAAAPSSRHERTPANLQRRFPPAPQPHPVASQLAEAETPAA